MAVLRIFSYLPNPRIWKATIAARIAGLPVEVRGAPPNELTRWLWDFDARPLTDVDRADTSLLRAPRTGLKEPLFKTDAFLRAHPYGTVPAAFGPDGVPGVFESNSIMRLVGRLAPASSGLYGGDAYEAARIDGFLDVALVFARDSQLYLFSLVDGSVDPVVHARAAAAFDNYVSGIERALDGDGGFIMGDNLTLADICFVAELCLFSNERTRTAVLAERGLEPIWRSDLSAAYPRAFTHFTRLCDHPSFQTDVGPYMAKLDAAAVQ